MKNLLLYITFLFFSFSMFSQTSKKEVFFDDSFIEQKKFDSKKIEKYKAQDEFIYIVEKREPTIIEKAWNWFKRTIKKVLSYIFDDISPAVGFLKIVLGVLPYIIAGLVFFFIIKFFLKVNARNILEGKTAKSIVNLSDEEMLIKERDLSKLIKQAIAEENYKLATRYYYLLVLKNLSEKELISWQQEKTNEDYIKELALNKVLNKEFKKLTHLYDYVWYGEFLIDKEKFLQAEANFKKVIAKI
ncbi:DUF4129 domain-containing protein [Tenacibaculum insulae]|uniref:DUF4129 domain-containing protein n=1 Tax=Tenacibaculum insulae TaxID=2029677 RepID=UPI003AB3F569